ncbi:MAG: hypothetical protein MRZ79_20400 [Bacteroidia bacterium]|nr:hypothetical protein [Bacteroidia bacterium]
MNPGGPQEKLSKELQEKIFPINSYIPKFNEQIAFIKSFTDEDSRWERRLKLDTSSNEVLGKIKKSELSEKDLTFYLSLIQMITEGRIEFRERINGSYEEALEIKELYMEKRQLAIEESKMILKGEMGRKITKAPELVEKVLTASPKEIKIKRRYRELPKAYFRRGSAKKNKIDYAIGVLLTEMSSRCAIDSIDNWLIKLISKKITVSKNQFSNWNTKDKAIRELKLSNKEKYRASKDENKWLFECIEVYQQMLLLRLKVEKRFRDFYRDQYTSISEHLQKSHLAIDGK